MLMPFALNDKSFPHSLLSFQFMPFSVMNAKSCRIRENILGFDTACLVNVQHIEITVPPPNALDILFLVRFSF